MISFRQVEKSDLPLLKYWRNSDIVRPFVREYRLLADSDQESWYQAYLVSRRKSDWDQEIMIIESDGKYLDAANCTLLDLPDKHSIKIPIGVGGFTRIEWRNRKAELTFYNFYQQYIKESIIALLVKGFDEFNFHKITWPVYSHDPNLSLYQTIFNTEAILKYEYWWDGKFQDRIYLSKFSV